MKNVGVQSMQGPMEGYLVSSPQSGGHRMVFSPHLFLQKGSQVCQIGRKPFVTGRDPEQGLSYHKARERFNSFWEIIFVVAVAVFGQNPTPGLRLHRTEVEVLGGDLSSPVWVSATPRVTNEQRWWPLPMLKANCVRSI